MNSFERLSKLGKLLECVGGEIRTRKKFHKLIYLLQELGEDFEQDFYYHHFGVFSQTLASDLEMCEDHGLIKAIQSNDANGYIFRLETGSNLSEFYDQINFTEEFQKISKELSNQEPRLLETLSTIVYLDRSYYATGQIKSKLMSLKPHLKEHYEKAFELARDKFDINIS